MKSVIVPQGLMVMVRDPFTPAREKERLEKPWPALRGQNLARGTHHPFPRCSWRRTLMLYILFFIVIVAAF